MAVTVAGPGPSQTQQVECVPERSPGAPRNKESDKQTLAWLGFLEWGRDQGSGSCQALPGRDKFIKGPEAGPFLQSLV